MGKYWCFVQNKDSYPLKYTLEAISHKDNNQKILEAGCALEDISYLMIIIFLMV